MTTPGATGDKNSASRPPQDIASPHGQAPIRLAHLAQALRLPFTTASVLPYVTGALLAPDPKRMQLFILGLIAVAGTHLSANVFNDYADARSGVDAINPTYFGFFGGSKLIQQGILPVRFFFVAGLALATVSAGAALMAALVLGRPALFLLFALVWTAGWAYSNPPAALVYHGLGELTIFLLFGLATACGGHILQTGKLGWDAVLVGLPHGFLVAGILIANEVPDAPEDRQAGKNTLVVRIGAERGYLLYALATMLAAAAIGAAVARAILPAAGLAAIPAAVIPAAAAVLILRSAPFDKFKLVKASKLAIAAHIAASLAMIMALLFGKGTP